MSERLRHGPPGDDDLRRLFHSTADQLTHGVTRPPVREVIHRARSRSGTPSDGRPAPLAAILGLAATPLVIAGAVLIGPAGAGIVGGDEPPAPTGTAPTGAIGAADPGTPTPTSVASPATEVAESSGGASAVTPLTEVTVFLSDGLLVDEGCRRLTAVTRLVPADDAESSALRALFEGPRPGERAAGLVDQFSADPATGPQAPTPVTVTTDGLAAVVDVPDAAWTGGSAVECRQDEVALAIARTVAQFDGWTASLQVGGSAEAGTAYLAADTTVPQELVEPSPDPVDVLDDPSLPPSEAPVAEVPPSEAAPSQ